MRKNTVAGASGPFYTTCSISGILWDSDPDSHFNVIRLYHLIDSVYLTKLAVISRNYSASTMANKCELRAGLQQLEDIKM